MVLSRVTIMKLDTKLIAFTALIAVSTFVLKLARTPNSGTGYTRANAPIWGLPANASDIDFVIRAFSPVNAYSFATDETSFTDWSENHLGLKDFRRGHVSIQGIDATSGAATTIECEDGIEYNWSEEDRGQYTLFDRTRRRAYYFAHTR